MGVHANPTLPCPIVNVPLRNVSRAIIKVESFNDPRALTRYTRKPTTRESRAPTTRGRAKASLRGRRTNLKRLPRDTTTPEKKLPSLSLSLSLSLGFGGGAAGFALKKTPTRTRRERKKLREKEEEKEGKGRTWYSRQNYASRICSHEPRLSRDTHPEFGSNLFRCIFVPNISRFVRSLLSFYRGYCCWREICECGG